MHGNNERNDRTGRKQSKKHETKEGRKEWQFVQVRISDVNTT